MKAIDQAMRADKRRLRASAFTAQILHIVGKYVDNDDLRRDCMRDLSYELFEKAWEAGIEIITDEDRRLAGLSPRGPDGWTLEEIAILEQKRLAAVTGLSLPPEPANNVIELPRIIEEPY
jgi:hypothetical protein